MVLLNRALQEDSKTSRFAILRIFHELILNFKDHSKLLQTSPYSTIPLSLWLFKEHPGFSFLKTRGPWDGSEGEAGFDRLFPGEGLTGGEVWVGGNGV